MTREATVVVVLMEAMKKEVIEAVSKFKDLEAFIDEVREAILDSFLKGFKDCKKKVGRAFTLQGLTASS